jgi:hypothetical protein
MSQSTKDKDCFLKFARDRRKVTYKDNQTDNRLLNKNANTTNNFSTVSPQSFGYHKENKQQQILKKIQRK